MTEPAAPTVVLTQKWPDEIETAMAAQYDLRPAPPGPPRSADQIVAACDGARILCPSVGEPIDGDLIRRLPDTIELLASYGVGTDHIDLEAARDLGLIVSNTPEVVTVDTADMAIGLMIAVCRRFAEGDPLTRSGKWEGFKLLAMLGTQMTGKTLGIVGLGRIGQAVAQRAMGFEMDILYHQRHRDTQAERRFNARYCDLEILLGDSDIVSLHCPLTRETHHLIDKEALSRMKESAFLINTGRGPLVDEAALVGALERGEIAGAGLDVYEHEPALAAGLADLENTVLIPHLGTATHEARRDMGRRVIANIDSFLATGDVVDRVV